MKIRSVEIKRYCRNFTAPLQTSRGTVYERAGYLIRLTADDSRVGLGEAAPLIGYSPDTLDGIGECLSNIIRTLAGQEIPSSLDKISSIAAKAVPISYPSARFGLETALADLAAQSADLPLSLWLDEKARKEVAVNYFLSPPVVDWEDVRRRIVAGGYGTAKVKVGRDIDDDVEFVRLARQNLGDRIALRLDANRGWSYAAAEEALWRLKYANIEYIEEPHEKFDPVRVRELRRVTGNKVALDESLIGTYEPETLIAGGVCDVFIFKPTMLGGISRTVELARLAESYHRRVVMTSTMETEIGLAALLHLAASFGESNCVCGLDTLRLYENPDRDLSTVAGGVIKVPGGLGLGLDAKIWNNA